MDIANNLMIIRKFLEDNGADEKTMNAWMELRDEVTKLIYMAMQIKGTHEKDPLAD